MANPDDDFYSCLLATFREDAEDLLTDITDALIKYENSLPDPDPSLIEEIFRKTHSLKGASRAVNLREIESIFLNMENIFSLMKREEFRASADDFDLFHEAIKSVKDFLSGRDSQGIKPAEVTQRLRGRLAERILQENSINKPDFDNKYNPERIHANITGHSGKKEKIINTLYPDPAAVAAPSSFLEVKPAEYQNEPKGSGYQVQSDSITVDSGTIRIASKKLEMLISSSDNLISTSQLLNHRMNELDEVINRFPLWKRRHNLVYSDLPLIKEILSGKHRNSLPPELLLFLERVVDFLTYDREFVTNLNYDLVSHIHATYLAGTALEVSTTEIASLIHDAVLLPVSSILLPITSQIREISRSMGKEVDLKTEGGKIEMDRRILDMLKVPLLHLINNCVDHGIEYPEERIKSGKPFRGQISIKFIPHSGSKVEIILSDDGKGIDANKIRDTARQNVLISDEEYERMKDEEILTLIFRSGFSTSRQVGELSGRGLGLSIVEDTIRRLGGEIIVSSEIGRGTTFSLLLPVKIATLRGLVVREGNYLYVIPIYQIIQVMKVPGEKVIVRDYGYSIKYNEELIQVIRLAKVLGNKSKDIPFDAKSDIQVIIISHGVRKVSFALEEIINVQEIVVRSMGSQLKRVKRVTGATILADGRLALVLDTPEMILKAFRLLGEIPISVGSVTHQGKVLLVEDSVTSRAYLGNVLETAGFEVISAADGMEAFDRLPEEDISLIVTDVDMPRMNGFTLTEKVRSDERFSNIPIILVTALDSEEDKKHGMSLGANAYILKNSLIEIDLINIIMALLSQNPN